MTKSQTLEMDAENEDKTLIDDFLSERSFKEHLKHYDHLPWLQEIKQEAWKQFQALPMPKRTNEKWRFSDLKRFDLKGFQFPHTKIGHERVDIARLSSIVSDFAGRIIFEDNHLLRHDYVSDLLKDKGVIWEPLSEAFENHPELVQQYFAKQRTHLGSEKFHYLNLAYAHAGTFLYVPQGIVIDEPLVAYHWAQEPLATLLPQTIIVAQENSQVTLIDVYVSHTETHPALAIAVGSLFAEKGARVSRKTIQNWNKETLSFQLDSVIAQEKATARTVSISIGAKEARFENQVLLDGDTAQAHLYSLSIADGEQEFDQRSYQEHIAPNTVSNLLYKNALMDQSRTIFSGMIKVHPSADKTDAYQTNRNLLLSEDAVASSLPGLEIEANDVKCSHGATSGKLDESELFYMLSRGISKDASQHLLVFGFLEEILGKIENKALMDGLREMIEKKLNKSLLKE